MSDENFNYLYDLNHLISPEIRLFQKTIQDWGAKNFLPQITTWFESGILPKTIFLEMGKLGLFQIGADLDAFAYGMVCQSLEKLDSGLRSIVSVQNALTIFPITKFGSESQQTEYLPKLKTGELIGCFGLTEPSAGSDPGGLKTTAEWLDTEQQWVLNGNKLWITNATWADIAIVWARVKKTNQIQGFIVPTHIPGFQARDIKHKMSMRASNTGELILQNCRLPKTSLLPGTEIGLPAALQCLTEARYGIAWGAIGAAMTCYEIALKYCQQRKVFDQALASKQLIQHALVKMYTEIVKAQALNYQVSQFKNKSQARYDMVSLIKKNACREALTIARNARELLGANGISLEYHVIRHVLNLETVLTYEGTDQVHDLIVGRSLTGASGF